MKILLDFFPIALFFVVYKTRSLHFYENEGMHSAIIAMGMAMILQVLITRLRTKKFEKSQTIGLVFLLVFGGMTIYIDNAMFIMWKVSILYVVFSAVLIGSLWLGKQPLLQKMLGKGLQLPGKSWQQLTWLWGGGFIGIALVNAYYYVLPSMAANDAFFGEQQRFGLSGFDCNGSGNQQLCLSAQQAEASWVNFKLFGTMGLTLILIVITLILMNKHLKKPS